MRHIAIAAGLLVLVPSFALAGPPSGYEIAKKAHDDSSGFKGQKHDSIMELYDPSGKRTVQYKLKQFALEGTADNDNTTKTLIRFIAPADSKGTGLLTHEKKGGSESRWLYLAETRQVKQIGGGSKSASFKGSELTYEDLSTETLDKYEYKRVGEAKVGGHDCWQVQAIPKFEGSGYSKMLSYYDKKTSVVRKAEFYDKAGKLLKVATTTKYKKVQGKWRPGHSECSNVQTKRKTIMKMGNYKLGIRLSPKLFTVSQLQKS